MLGFVFTLSHFQSDGFVMLPGLTKTKINKEMVYVVLWQTHGKLRDSKASTECNFEIGENEYGIGKTHVGQTNPAVMVMTHT